MSDEYMMTDEELRVRDRNRRRLLRIAVAVVVLIVLVVFGARPARDAIKSWQARRHAQKAFAFIEQEKWTDARDEAIAAYQLRPNEPEALRAVARFLSRTRQAEALDFWKQLQDRQSLTRQDGRDQAAIAMATEDLTNAEIAVNDLLTRKDSPPAPADWLLAAQLALQKSANDDALKFTQQILDAPAADERTQLQAAVLTIAIAARENPPATSTDKAWSRLKKLAEGKSKTSLDALVLLAQRALSEQRTENTEQKTEVSGRTADVDLVHALENHPLATASHKLLALDLVRAGLEESVRGAVIDQAINQFKNADATSLVALATWLNGKGEYQKTIDTIPLEKSLQSRDLFLQYVDALGALDRWGDIRQLLDSERFPLDPVIQRMYLARCNAQLGEKTAAENNWKRALEAAAGDAGKLLTLADYAEKNGMGDIASTAFDRAAAARPKLRAAQQGRLRRAQATRDTKKIHAILAEMLALWPNDMAIQNDEAYTRLLLTQQARERTEDRGQTPDGGASRVSSSTDTDNRQQITDNSELPAIIALAESLVQRKPRSLPHRTLLALAYLKQNRFADALAVYENVQVAPKALSPSALAVHAAVLAANANLEDAKTEKEQVPEDKLLPEERALLANVSGNE